MKSINYLILDVGGEVLNWEIETKSGVVLYKDPTWEREWNKKQFGRLAHESVDLPEIPIGAKVYIHYLQMDDENLIKDGNSMVLKVPVSSAFCWASEGKVTMLHGNMLVEPTVSSNEDLVRQAKESGLYLQSAVEKSKTSGVVVHSAKGETVGLKCAFDEREAFLNRVEGQDLYLMLQDDAHLYSDLEDQLRGEEDK